MPASSQIPSAANFSGAKPAGIAAAMRVEPIPRALLAPRWWPAWLALGLLRVVALLPVSWLQAIGAALGRMSGRLLKSRRHIVRTNLRLCFPELDDVAREQRVDAHFAALGTGIFEVLIAWFVSDRRLRPLLDVSGYENLLAARADDRGILLLTGHFTTMELACRLLHLAGCPFYGMYRKADNAFADYWVRRFREARVGLPMVPKEDLKRIVRVLRHGGAVWYGPDQTLEAAGALFVPFFGVPALTLTATSRLVQMGRARVIAFFPQRVGGRYRLVFEPALENFPSGDDAADAARVNQLLETAIRRCPEQYFWIHRKFKYRPPGVADFYANRAA